MSELLQIKAIGRFKSEGMGKINWLKGKIVQHNQINNNPKRKLRIRKGLPHNLPKELQKLIRYGLLHDFVNTSKHKSKIYVEPDLTDLEDLRRHHDQTEDKLIRLFQKYDRISAIITRKVRSPRTNRYNWSSTGTIDFEKLDKEISEMSNNIWKLYEYIYNSKELPN
ncbi:MAG: hypothetical protein ACFFBD_00180 [Candidatus Hodarchaeota archaeon]